jgi:hypothetical protein
MVELNITYFEFRNTIQAAIAVASGAMEMQLVQRLNRLLENVLDDE